MLSAAEASLPNNSPKGRGRDASAALSMTLLWVATLTTHAQHQPTPRVYTYVEQMPELPGGGGMAAVASEFLKRVRVPAVDLREQIRSRYFIYFEVSPIGTVQHIRLRQSSGSAGIDSALVAAVRALPRFRPGRQHGRPITVRLTLPISCLKFQ